jgi:hypothetical protein
MVGGRVANDGERRLGRDGGRGVRRAVPALAVGFALVMCSQALAAEPHATTVSVDCGSGVVVSQPTKCTATVTDIDTEATPSTPTGTVTFISNSEGTFSPSTGCELPTLAGTERAAICSVTYDPTTIGTGSHEITATYSGDLKHPKLSGPPGMLAVGLRGTTVSVSCGSGVVVPQGATCTATVSDTAEGTTSTPEGIVSFRSDSPGASFGPSKTCALSPLDSGTKSGCSLEYAPGQVGSGVHAITADYGGDDVHAAGSASGMLAVSAPPIPTALVVTTTTPVPGPPASPAPPKCRVTARERWRVVRSAKRRAHRRRVPVILVTYTCDQNAAVRIGGVVTIAPTRHGRKTTKAQAINLAAVSSSAVLGKAAPGVDVRLPASAAKAVRNGVRAAVAVAFRVFNANGVGVGTIRFPLFPPARATHKRR